ncbi:hypothetical protein EK21DRAFT_76162, partial [Setomelanomma holmii]
FNRHLWDLDFKWHAIQRQFVMAIYVLFSLASGFIKMSILLFYRRLSARSVSPTFRWTLRITIAVIGVYTIIFVFVTVFMCSPVSAFWASQDIKNLGTDYSYKCANEGAEIVANGDFIAASLPAALCWNLQMPLRQKVALYSVFAVSYVVVALGAVRTYSCYYLFFDTYDIHIGAICANAPAVKAFYAHYFKTTLPPSYGSHPHSNMRSQQRQSPTTTNASTTSSLWAKIPFWKRGNLHSSNGYLSESQTHMSSKHGNIVKMDAYSGRKHEQESIEMGRIQARRVVSIQGVKVEGRDVEALPSVQEVKGWKPW